MKKLIVDTQTLENAAKVLTELFPMTESQPVYSVGFQRWQKRKSFSKAKNRERADGVKW